MLSTFQPLAPQQAEVSHVHTYNTHTLLCSFRLKMYHLNSRLVLNARYIPIAHSEAEVLHVHTYITHKFLCSFSLKMSHLS